MPDRRLLWIVPFLVAFGGCRNSAPSNHVRVSGHVEATDVQISPEVGGRLIDLRVDEGVRVTAGEVIARIDTRDTELAIDRARADRAQAEAQFSLTRAGSRREDIEQAAAQASASQAEVTAAAADLEAANADLARYEALLSSNAGSRKQRDDAKTRRDVADSRLASARNHARAAQEALSRMKAGSRPQEIQAASARLAAADAQIATLQKQLADATVSSPVTGIVTEKLVDQGEIVAPRTPIVVVTDLDHAWAEVFVDEPAVPRLKLGQRVTVYTDAGGQGIGGTITFVSPKAEFTPRNVQTADERSRLVYRVKITVDNRAGVLKTGMPVEADIPLQ